MYIYTHRSITICIYIYAMSVIQIHICTVLFVRVTSKAVRCGNSFGCFVLGVFIHGARRHGNAMWQDFHVKRGQAYMHRIAGQEVYNGEPEFQKMPMALPEHTFEMPPMPPLSNHALMQNGIGWGGFVPPPSPVSNHVQLVLQNIFFLQCLGPVQAEQSSRKQLPFGGP